MKDTVLFPTIGEFTKFLFDVSGILPTKGERDSVFTEKDKKTLQKLLLKLSNEEGMVLDNYLKAKASLIQALTQIMPDSGYVLAANQLVNEIEMLYRKIIVCDASHLSKKENMRWSIEGTFPQRLVLSFNKLKYLYGLSLYVLPFPKDQYWFLPSDDGEMPISKYFSWLYSELDTNRTHFHYPGRSVDKQCSVQELNLNNVTKWCSGSRLPSWSGFKSNLQFSFESMSSCQNVTHQRVVSEERIKDYSFVGFLALFSTRLFRNITDHFGSNFSNKLVNMIMTYQGAIEYDCCNMMEIQESICEFHKGNIFEIRKGLIRNINIYWSELADRTIKIGRVFDQKLIDDPDFDVKEFIQSHDLIHSIGPYMTFSFVHGLRQEHHLTGDSLKLIGSGLELLNKQNVSDEQVDSFLIELDSSGFYEELKWMLLWSKARRAFDGMQYDDAHLLYKDALIAGKYSCGKSIELLVDEYLQISSKLGKWKEFRKELNWCVFIGIPLKYDGDIKSGKSYEKEMYELYRKASKPEFLPVDTNFLNMKIVRRCKLE